MVKNFDNATNRVSLKTEVLLAALVLMILVGLGPAAYGESEKKSDKPESDQINLIDPFELTVMTISDNRLEGSSKVSSIIQLLSESSYMTPQIKIPYRPILRSAFRPPSEAPL